MIRINGTGCCILDRLCSPIALEDSEIESLLSKKTGDGGIVPGGLVLMEELSRFSGLSEDNIRNLIMGKAASVITNLGGVGIIPLIHLRQMDVDNSIKTGFYQFYGPDATGETLLDYMLKNRIDTDGFREIPGRSPETLVLSSGKERSFISRMGTAGQIGPEHLDDFFYNAEVLLYGATALSPRLHGTLDTVLSKGRQNGSVNIVLTVHDFHSEKTCPGRPWIMGRSNETYKFIDILIGNREEALGLSGKKNFSDAVKTLKTWGLKNMIFTDGENGVFYSCSAPLFSTEKEGLYPVPAMETMEKNLPLKESGDTTGCGDNFGGGVAYAVCRQINASGKKSDFDIVDILRHAVAAGTLGCFYRGGAFRESGPGEKKALIDVVYSLTTSTIPF